MKRGFAVGLAVAIVAGSAYPTSALTALEMVRLAEEQMRGETSHSEVEMTVITPEWQRTMRLEVWEAKRDEKAFVRVLAPAKERGTASLKLGNEMWTYIPSIERSMKIPPSMMMQSWLGSDFTNDDMLKASSLDDYEHALTDTTELDGQTAYVITSIPKPDAPVVWGKIVYYARLGDYLPIRQEFYDEDGNIVRRMDLSEFKRMGGRVIPTVYTLVPLTEETTGHQTTLTIHSAAFNVNISESIFTRANLERTR